MTIVMKMTLTKMKHTKMKTRKTTALHLAGRVLLGLAEDVVVTGQPLSY